MLTWGQLHRLHKYALWFKKNCVSFHDGRKKMPSEKPVFMALISKILSCLHQHGKCSIIKASLLFPYYSFFLHSILIPQTNKKMAAPTDITCRGSNFIHPLLMHFRRDHAAMPLSRRMKWVLHIFKRIDQWFKKEDCFVTYYINQIQNPHSLSWDCFLIFLYINTDA